MNGRGVNLILVAVCLGLMGTLFFTLRLLQKARQTIPAAQVLTELVTNTVKETRIAVRKIDASNFLAAIARRPLNWFALESTNYLQFVENLRAFGCPEDTIRDIVLTDIAKTFAEQRAALMIGAEHRYWQNASARGAPYAEIASPTLRAQLVELDRQRDGLVGEVLGVDFQSELLKYWGREADGSSWKLSFLPDTKRAQVMEIRQKYEQLEQALYEGLEGALSEGDLARVNQLRAQQQEELTGLLTPEELENYRLRLSPEAEGLRTQLEGFSPSEQEFRAVFRVQEIYRQTLDQALAASPNVDPVARAQAEEQAARSFEQELERNLGANRYEQFARSQDKDYRQLLSVTSRLGLPDNVANQAYEMRAQALQQKEQIALDPNLSVEQRERALAAIANETERSLSALLGEQPFRTYRSIGGEWIDTLRSAPEATPEPEPPPAPPGFPVFPLSPVPY